jgi:hypothetical protein
VWSSPQYHKIKRGFVMKKLSEIDIIKSVGFDLQESVGDLISILKNLQIDIDKIKLVLKDKNIIE